MFCQCLLCSKVTQLYIHIHSFSHITLHHVPSKASIQIYKEKKKNKLILKVTINIRNSKRINMKMFKKDIEIITCGEGK